MINDILQKNVDLFYKFKNDNKEKFNEIADKYKDEKFLMYHSIKENDKEFIDNLSLDILNELIQDETIIDFKSHFNVSKNTIKYYSNDPYAYHATKKQKLLANYEKIAMVCLFLPDVNPSEYTELKNIFNKSFVIVPSSSLHDICIFLNKHNDFPCGGCEKRGYTVFNLNTGQVEFLAFDIVNSSLVYDLDNECEVYKENNRFSYDITITIPSRKVVIANNLLPLVSKHIEKDNYYSLDSFISMAKYAKFYERNNIFYGQGTNSSFDILKHKTANEYLFSLNDAYSHDAELKDDGSKGLDFLNEYDGENVIKSFSMDLWGYMAMDYNLFKEYCDKNNMSIEEAINETDAFVLDLNDQNANALRFTSYCNEPDEYYDHYFFGTAKEITI